MDKRLFLAFSFLAFLSSYVFSMIGAKACNCSVSPTLQPTAEIYNDYGAPYISIP